MVSRYSFNIDLVVKIMMLISSCFQVSNDEKHDEMDYVEAPKTDFQKFIRLSEDGKL